MKFLALCVGLLALGCGDDDGAVDSSVADMGTDSAVDDGGPDEGVSVDAAVPNDTTVPDTGMSDVGDDASPTDAGADTTLTDSGPRPLCFHNRDCEDDERCEDLSGMNMPHCEVGERGVGDFGAVCISENDCASGLCTGDERGFFCSDYCVDPPMVECTDPLPRCLAGICLPPASS